VTQHRPFRKTAFGRALALLAGIAVLNMLVVPEVSACDHTIAPAPSPSAMDHGMAGHHAASADDAAMASHHAGQQQSSVANAGSDCGNMDGHCASNCALMAGCTASAFVAPHVAGSAPGVGQAMTPWLTVASLDRDSAPDHPPPRA